MTKKEFDARLKTDADANGITIDGDFVVFDKKSNLSYELIKGLTLGDLLTANPVSVTRLNKNLLVALDAILVEFDGHVAVRSSYHSHEYELLNFGQSDSDLYTAGNAVALKVPSDYAKSLYDMADRYFTGTTDNAKTGEVGLYSWGVHIGYTKDYKRWDNSTDLSFKQKFKDFLTNDKMKNIALIGAAAVGVWFFFIRKK